MAVITIADIGYRKFSGYEDPALPSGFWFGAATTTGDATGGTNTLQFDFTKSTGLFNSQYYSLEQIMVNQAAATSPAMALLIANFELTGGMRYSLPLLTNEGSNAGLIPSNTGGLVPLFLGQQRAVNTAMSISFTLTNDDTVVITVMIQGYVWSVRSTSVPGGPQRPVNGLYRA
ncbi:hypothetical protein LCGC14_2276450 [marine sediment metagenome]|uniref:Uncharacterized protein n=1 Tax=marine sediment metagenome TaxID=412755 RepID=A0A0F9DHP2_9ZZZZ